METVLRQHSAIVNSRQSALFHHPEQVALMAAEAGAEYF
jgi:hypothetical protein